MFKTTYPIVLSEEERRALERMSRSRSGRSESVLRARIILGVADGESYGRLKARLHTTSPTIARWVKRFQKERLAGLESRYKGSKPRVLTPKMHARILAETRKPPPDGSTHWSTRRMGRHLGVSHMLVARAWRMAGLKPHRFERYTASPDPDFEAKAADIIGLYLNPPAHAAVFSLDEKTAIQALDRTLPVLPLSPGRAERHGFEYKRCGTLSLYAALDVRTGQVIGETAPRHTSREFVAFLDRVVGSQARRKEIHVILDNLSAHKTPGVRSWLAEHPNVTFHFTPTYASWLNQIELWFSKIERDLIHRGIFKSTADLRRKIIKYIREQNKRAQPFKWAYSEPSRRIAG